MKASAPAKLILCGEHAVVYGRPAIALPLGDVRAAVSAAAGARGAGLLIDAPGLGRRWSLGDAPDDPLSELAAATLAQLGAPEPDLTLTIASDIPIAGGMGSGAAVATALVRALAQFHGRALPPEQVDRLVFQSERRLHGTPSGIDNTVIAFERPIWFQRVADDRPTTTDDRQPTLNNQGVQTSDLLPSSSVFRPPSPPRIEPIAIAAPFTLLIGDSGVRSATRLPVGEVRRRWQAEPARYEALFDAVAELVAHARAALQRGDVPALGPLLDQNHGLLQEIGVSSPELDRLVDAARAAGALGAKLSGAGWGGVMLALVAPGALEQVAAALRAAGATRVLSTVVAPHAADKDIARA